MKALIAIAVAALGLAGCVAVPAYDPGYAYSPGYYAPPPATFSFGYSYHDYPRGHYRGHRHRHR